MNCLRWASLGAVAGIATAGCAAAPKTSSYLGRAIQTVRSGSTTPTRRDLTDSAPSLIEEQQVAPAEALVAVRRTAERFLGAYVRFLYGQIGAAHVPEITRQIRSKLRQHPLTTPAERASRPRIIQVALSPAGPPLNVLATATVLAESNHYRLTATLEPGHGSWTVVAIGS